MRRRRRSQSNSNSDEHTYRFHGSTWGEGSLLALCNCLAVSSSPQVIEKIPRQWRPACTRKVKSQRTQTYLIGAAENRSRSLDTAPPLRSDAPITRYTPEMLVG